MNLPAAAKAQFVLVAATLVPLSWCATARAAAQDDAAELAGYAVFSNFGLKILVAGSGKGSGLAVDNKTRKETFMKMAELQAGLGFGAKKFRQVWVFKTKTALDGFIDSGWEFGAQSTAAAAHEGEGGAVQGAISVNPDIWVYQMTDEGLALELTAKSTKYYQDKKLN